MFLVREKGSVRLIFSRSSAMIRETISTGSFQAAQKNALNFWAALVHIDPGRRPVADGQPRHFHRLTLLTTLTPSMRIVLSADFIIS